MSFDKGILYKHSGVIVTLAAKIPAISLFLVLMSPFVTAQSQYHKEIPRTDERELSVRLESAYGSVEIGRGAIDRILEADMLVEPTIDIITNINYTIDRGRGKLQLELKRPEQKRKTISLSGGDSGTWSLRFSENIPMYIDVELGAGKGSFDFTGLTVNHLNISTGASTVTVRFDKPNPGFIEHMKIESGVSRFTGESLGNANFRNLTFQGGVGSYVLDFNGEMNHEGNVNVGLGLGSVTIIVPPDLGVRLIAQQRWFSSVDVPKDFIKSKNNEHISPNFNQAKGKLTIRVESGMGSVKVQR
jgi:DUF4097 and DUF4098 domain-containing protein YvlB